jgi:hypothetical protein
MFFRLASALSLDPPLTDKEAEQITKPENERLQLAWKILQSKDVPSMSEEEERDLFMKTIHDMVHNFGRHPPPPEEYKKLFDTMGKLDIESCDLFTIKAIFATLADYIRLEEPNIDGLCDILLMVVEHPTFIMNGILRT